MADWKSILATILDPKIVAGVTGYVGYRYLGKDKQGVLPYAYGIGGAVAGYLVGKGLQTFLAAPTDEQRMAAVMAAAQQQQLQPPPAEAQPDLSDYLDLDDRPSTQRALPPAPVPVAAAHPPAVIPYDPETGKVDTRADSANDTDLLDGLGSYAGTGDDGLGSYGNGVDEAALAEAQQEVRAKRTLKRKLRRGNTN